MATKKRHRRKQTPYPQQSSVTYHKEISHDKKKYFTLDTRRNNQAMHKLSGNAYKMYIYLSQHMNGETFLISSSLFVKATGASDRAYQLAKKELIQNRYLIQREDGNFDFYNAPLRQHHETVFEKMGITEEEYILSQGCANAEEKS